MTSRLPRALPLTLSALLTGVCMASFGATADEGDTRAHPMVPAHALQPMQILAPPMWQPHPPAWYRPDLHWRQRQPTRAPEPAPEERPARSHWERHAPEWMNLPLGSDRTTLWKPQSLTPTSAEPDAADSPVAPVEVPPPDLTQNPTQTP